MITLEANMIVKDATNLRLASAAGEYDDTALVECYDPENPEIGLSMYQAQYVKYGNLVYYYNDPKELGAALLALDPESTHTAASFVRMTNELLTQMNDGSLEGSTLETAIGENQAVSPEEPIIEEPEATTPPPTETPEPDPTETLPEAEPVGDSVPEGDTEGDIDTILPPENATSTPDVLGTSTTTEAVPVTLPDPVVDEVSTTTPELISLMKKKVGRSRRA